MRWVGSIYILYLVYNILKTDYSLTQENKDLQQMQPLAFKHGVFLQLFNPKGLMFAITIYTVFLYLLVGKLHLILISTIILGLIGFGSYLLWAFLGAGISNLLNQEHFKRTVNLILALLLVYSAIKLTGIINL
jgi:cysteine/O-acetylserine efflux protein